MSTSDKLHTANKIIKKQTELIKLFDDWVLLIKANNLEAAAEMVKKANLLRKDIILLKNDLERLNKKSEIILLN